MTEQTAADTQVKRIWKMPPSQCAYCDQHRVDEMMPWHDPSPRCESGKRKHCTCDTCF